MENDRYLSPQETLVVKRRIAIARARTELIPFIRLCMPDPEDPNNPELSLYEVEGHHAMLAEMVERVQRRQLMRSALAIPPQHGKSTILSRFGVAWMAGIDPFEHTIVGTYNSDFAREIGDHVREIMNSDTYRQVFPNLTLSTTTKSKSDLGLIVNGKMAGSVRFRGRGEATTGRPADRFVIDDPYKDKQEADSDIIRKECRDWYTSVVFSRCHVRSTIMIVHTRWNEDDLIGWICDPEHPHHDARRAKRWSYINVPAVVYDPKLAEILGIKLEEPTDPIIVEQFGRMREVDGKPQYDTRPMGPLWKRKFPLEHLAEACENDKGVFFALYMGKPAPDDGIYFKAEMLIGYEPHELPPKEAMHFYGASDHALTEKQRNDSSCFGCAGYDEDGILWILPDLVWDRMETDVMTEAMLDQMLRHRPLVWWAERDHISKAIGPFLRQRQREERIYTYVEESPAIKDITARSRAMQGRMAMKMVRFPKFAPWWAAAQNELLKFPNATHDDFISFLSHLGMGLDRLVGKRKPKPDTENVVRVGSIAWIKAASDREKRIEKMQKAAGGM